MTSEEYSIKKEEIDNNRIKEENDSLTKIKNKYNNLYKELDNCRIKELNTVCIEAGDIITDGKVVLLVEKIKYVHGTNPDNCYIIMEENKKTKRQIEAESAMNEMAKRTFLRKSECLLHWMEFRDLFLGRFYEDMVSLSEVYEDNGKPEGFGFAMCIYDTTMKHLPYFSYSCRGLFGTYRMFTEALLWMQEEARRQSADIECSEPEEEESLTASDEWESGLLRNVLEQFADACEAAGKSETPVNIYLRYYDNDIPEADSLELENIEFDACLQEPKSMTKKIQNIIEQIFVKS